MSEHAKWLRLAATEIRDEGHNGWGNTCEQAADKIEELEAENIELETGLIAEATVKGRIKELEAERDEARKLAIKYANASDAQRLVRNGWGNT